MQHKPIKAVLVLEVTLTGGMTVSQLKKAHAKGAVLVVEGIGCARVDQCLAAKIQPVALGLLPKP